MKSSSNLFHTLLNREINGFKRPRSIQKEVSTRVQENIAMDKYSLKRMETISLFLGMRPSSFSISDDRSKIVLDDLGPLALYDLSKQKKLWSISSEGSDTCYTSNASK